MYKRQIDLSYAAAVKLGVHRAGTARVEVRALTVNDRGPDMRVAQTSSNVAPTVMAPPVSPPSAMDRMVAALPIASAEAGERKSGAAAPAEPPPAAADKWRFDMKQDGKPMTADEFDAWMKARQVRVATGKATAAGTATTPTQVRSEAAAPAPAIQPRPAAVAATPEPPRPVTPPASPASDAVVLQVASFAARGNAERALAMLEGAGIRDARLLDAVAAGQKVWRLRVGPVASDRVAELSATVAGLGFGRPNIVRE